MQASVLVVDDDPAMRELLAEIFHLVGYDFALAADGMEALQAADCSPPDVVILDLALPDMDGQEVCQQMRERGDTPIIVLTARADEAEKIALFQLGADDYIVKPCSPGELVARIEAVLRRTRRSQMQTQGKFLANGLEIDLEYGRVTLDGQPVRLTNTEWKLLCFLAQNPGKFLASEAILEHVWGSGYAQEKNYLHTYIRRLRRKLSESARNHRFILTHHGAGYRFIG